MLMQRVQAAWRPAPRVASTAIRSYTTENTKAPVQQFVNRNPRSAELTGLQAKKHGFYHKVLFSTTGNHTYAEVINGEGERIVSASTREGYVREHLYGTNNVSAARNIGRILGQRLVESGLSRVTWDRQGQRFHGKVKAFVMGLQEGGATLKEA